MNQPNELYSLLIPLREERLLVPRICIAEVIAFADAPERPPGEFPDWFVGTVEWSGRRVPVVTLDGDHGTGSEKRRGRRRIVIFHALTQKLAGRYYGVLTQGFPQLVRVNREVLTADGDYTPPADRPILCRVRMIHEFPVIPDFEGLEDMIAELPAL
ncbi:MAG TPA: chemotaxis protein CheW [Gammaproteobacteria bacterium]|nr:chemotaxis protein CheW [Gammaproteobacteria bacterium]